MNRVDSFVDERDYELLKSDRYTFFVMKRVMGEDTTLLLSDHERVIICFTGNPFPVWIWTPDDVTEEEMERTYQLAKENEMLSGEYRFNLKYTLAEYFIKRAAEEGSRFSVSMNMYAYDCPDPIEPKIKAEGRIHCCDINDLEEVVEFLEIFHNNVGIDKKDVQSYRTDAESFIGSGNMYFWKDDQGNNVASCRYAYNLPLKNG
ncbi:MAG: hypothetical protein K6G24_06110 [Lachnospiraceae bacterium]|nr:hypothetical protein [Lachnospiraceae bacterium]